MKPDTDSTAPVITENGADPNTPALESQKEAAARVGLCRQTIWQRIKRGEFPAPVDIGGGRIAFRKEEIDAWIKTRPRVNYAA